MDYELRIIVEKVAVTSQEVVQRDTLKVYDVNPPESILELGLRHEEQISLLEKLQNSVLAAQSKLIDTGYDVCPKCGYKLSKMGFTPSKFHAVFSDHKVRIQKHKCKNPKCDWQSTPSTTSVFGTSIHPDLAKIQSEQGALYSYREAQLNIEKLMVHRRPINNANTIRLMTTQVGEKISQANLKAPTLDECAPPASEVIIQIDGGHIPVKDSQKRSFEALSAVAYRPENIRPIDNNHREITDKSCALSAEDDELVTMKTYALNIAHKQGMIKKTTVTALADGALNCWSVLTSLEPHCKKLICILDWFHIGMKFQNVRGSVGDSFQDSLDRIKWTLWHGNSEDALRKLELLISNVTDTKKRSKLQKLHDYLERNQSYLVNYKKRQTENKTFTSQVAETHIDSIINDRHKRSKKMQWTQEGAHCVLQIRGMITSDEWDENWQTPVLSALGVAA